MMKLKFLSFTLILFVLAGTSFAQNSLLWKISGNGLESPSYVFGTIHMICVDEMIRVNDLEKYVQETKQVVLELDMDDPSTMQLMQAGSLNAGMENIAGKIPEAKRVKLDAFFKNNYGAGFEQLGIMKPWMLSVMVSTHGVLNCTTPSAYEGVITELAKKHKKEVKGLETVAFQLALFDNIPMEEQLKMLTDALDEKKKYDTQFLEMIQNYLSEDIEALHQQFIESSPEMAKYADDLLYNRNKIWIPEMSDKMNEISTLFAVGAGHLGGDKGVIALLKKEGYTVEAVTKNE